MSPPPRPVALLRHDAPDGAHVDVLLGRPSPATDAWCWRSPARVDDLPPGRSVPLQPLGVHRELYLSLLEPRALSEGRGCVHPLRRGSWRPGSRGEVVITWEDGGEEWFLLEGDSGPLPATALDAATRLTRLDGPKSSGSPGLRP